MLTLVNLLRVKDLKFNLSDGSYYYMAFFEWREYNSMWWSGPHKNFSSIKFGRLVINK